MSSTRVYRYVPWLVGLSVVALLMAAGIVFVVQATVRAPGIDSVARAFVGLVPLVALGGFAVLSFRVRTTVDDAGVTQRWITKTYRVEFAEVTRVEAVHGTGRWFLRLHCADERTFEVFPCHTFGTAFLPSTGAKPRALRTAMADIERRRANA